MSAAQGRPRDAALDGRILAATYDLLLAHGYAGLRIDAVAAASGVAKTTIYRRWPTLTHLVVAAVAAAVGERTFRTTADPEQDLRELTRVGVESVRRAGPGLLAIALDIARQDDPELRRAYRAAMVDPIRAEAIGIIRRGQEQGRFAADVEAEDVADAVIGATVYRLVILHEDVTTKAAERVLDTLLRGLRA